MRGITEERLQKLTYLVKPGRMFISSDKLSITKEELLANCEELNPWQPIESAPLKIKIRLFSPLSYMPRQTEQKLYSESDRKHFTHWQELPEDPK